MQNRLGTSYFKTGHFEGWEEIGGKNWENDPEEIILAVIFNTRGWVLMAAEKKLISRAHQLTF